MAKEEPPLADEPRVGGEALGFLLLLLLLLLLSSPDVARGARAGARVGLGSMSAHRIAGEARLVRLGSVHREGTRDVASRAPSVWRAGEPLVVVPAAKQTADHSPRARRTAGVPCAGRAARAPGSCATVLP